MSFKRDTRQEILTEAFLLYEDLRNTKFSLSEIAAKVGISKTAIFRHFKNKDALIQVMTETVFTDFANSVNPKNFFFARSDYENLSYEEFSDVIKTVLSFFLKNRGYLGFTLNSEIAAKNANEPLFKSLQRHGVVFSKEYIDGAKFDRFFRVYFCAESMIYFLARRSCLLRTAPASVPDEETFKKSVVNALWNGIQADKNSISQKRKQELNELCKVQLSDAGEDTRFFIAFTEVFNEFGIEGITVERISEKLNLAKSSLYSYFNNKEEYVSKMLSKEMRNMMDMLFEKMKFAKSIEEIAYILLASERNYLEIRPFVLTIHNWASQQGFNNELMVKKESLEIQKGIAEVVSKGFVINSGMSLKTFLGWVSSLIGTLRIYFSVSTKIEGYTDILFDLICSGLSNSSKI